MEAIKFIFLSAICISGSLLSYTSNGIAPSIHISSDTTSFPAVETKKANSAYKPAFNGQTRIAGVRTVTSYKVDKLADKLGSPWAIIPMPDGRLLITDRTGF